MCRNETLLFRFVEDMDQDEISKAMEMPAGLQNLGNTCYMNATIQCLKTVPELRQALTRFQGMLGCIKFISIATKYKSTSISGSVSLGGGTDAESLTASLRDLYATMDKGSTIPPIIMLQVPSR